MEISSIFDKLEGLLPILIFVVWAIISAIGAAGSKTKRRNQQQQRQAPSSRPSHSSGDNESGGSVSTTISDELNRTLDVIFGNPSTDAGHGHKQTRREQTRKSSVPVTKQKKIAQKTSGKSNVKKGTSVADTIGSLERSAYLNRKIKNRSEEDTSVLTNFSAGEAVKGVIWSEILQPPASMRS